ncbi:hypothetical protein JK358_38525 [Nocardia sp. 2]|uniref:Uncharacterized protein n=1 Tax=Nocardia acididurans TaxID=2802282 RepID=A0ABS1MI24_9NOCA|nr:hypothetical protein [Nocardia acididurans]MBL1080308.1 hypothetical protein [Nocardia acididurans]
MIPTHRIAYNGERLVTLVGPHETVEDFRRPLSRLDGDDRYSLNLQTLPRPMWSEDLTDDDRLAMALEFLQCAGSADALSIEVRMLVDGASRLYTLGRPGDYTGDPSIRIPFQRGNHQLTVYPEEVFTADDAAELFFGYYRTRTIPTEMHLREIDLEAFTAEQSKD